MARVRTLKGVVLEWVGDKKKSDGKEKEKGKGKGKGEGKGKGVKKEVVEASDKMYTFRVNGTSVEVTGPMVYAQGHFMVFDIVVDDHDVIHHTTTRPVAKVENRESGEFKEWGAYWEHFDLFYPLWLIKRTLPLITPCRVTYVKEWVVKYPFVLCFENPLFPSGIKASQLWEYCERVKRTPTAVEKCAIDVVHAWIQRELGYGHTVHTLGGMKGRTALSDAAVELMEKEWKVVERVRNGAAICLMSIVRCENLLVNALTTIRAQRRELGPLDPAAVSEYRNVPSPWPEYHKWHEVRNQALGKRAREEEDGEGEVPVAPPVLEEMDAAEFDAIMESARQLESFPSPKSDSPVPEGKEITLAEEQRQALELVYSESGFATGIFGGAGSGKTTIMGVLRGSLAASTVMCFAPTNKATRELVRRVMPGSPQRVMTMHRMLYRMKEEELNKLFETTQLVIVDELSLVPLRVMALFLSELVKRCPVLRGLVLVGDLNQLKSVEYGNVIGDMAELLRQVRLKECHRVSPESQMIFRNAQRIIKGEIGLETGDSFHIVELGSNGLKDDLHRVLRLMGSDEWTSHVLTARNKDAQELSLDVRHFFRKNVVTELCVGDKVISKRNWAKADIVNGEIMRLHQIRTVQVDKDDEEIDGTEQFLRVMNFTNLPLQSKIEVTFAIPFTTKDVEGEEEPMTELEASRMNFGEIRSSLVLGYASTNHVYQGCEADVIVYYLPRSEAWIDREHLYTAVTRAKKRVIVLTTKKALVETIRQKPRPRFSNFVARCKHHFGTLVEEVDGAQVRSWVNAIFEFI